jgi:3-hydroxyisobutyrate dehydrogenase-like beta-hydroxyacid dehydrogenase
LHRSSEGTTSKQFVGLIHDKEADKMRFRTIALLHPGKMGVTIGAAAAAGGARILWVSHQRSQATRERAQQAGLTEVKTLPDAVRDSDLILSVCPPDVAVELARTVAKHHFTGVYVDANAVSRATAEEIGRIVSNGGAGFVDGGIIGAPVEKPGTTRLYLSGDRASEVAGMFSGSMLDARAIGQTPGAASALKIAYAAWTKCTDALLLGIRAYATMEGIDQALLDEWRLSQPQLERRCAQAAAVAAPKAWRYVGEMNEIAATFETHGLPGGFHNAAAEICARLQDFKDITDPPLTVGTIVETLIVSGLPSLVPGSKT